jgi:UDP-3-O-[3-hydroxymyristoyl] N-acetylglucosamine deacetylase
MQQTLRAKVNITGIGLHSGRDITMTLLPAEAGHGIVFVRTDIETGDNRIPALWDRVVDTQLCTVIANANGASVGTVEHLMAALRGCGVDNVLIHLDGPEVPAMDGSAMPFVTLIEEAGTLAQPFPRRAIRILRTVTVEDGDKRATLRPSDGSVFGGRIDFDHPEIGNQHFQTRLLNGNFKHDLAEARTFGFLSEVEYMRKNGLALGGSLDNAIVLDQSAVLNPGGLRWGDEFIRHKILDAVGDLYLAGGPIIGTYDSVKAGHAINNALLRAVFADPQAWESVDLYVEEGHRELIRPASRQNAGNHVPA